jgi:hypothetical protein
MAGMKCASWWVEDFEGGLRAAQHRMKIELSAKQVERVMERIQKLEEQELRGEATLRNPVVAGDEGRRHGE